MHPKRGMNIPRLGNTSIFLHSPHVQLPPRHVFNQMENILWPFSDTRNLVTWNPMISVLAHST